MTRNISRETAQNSLDKKLDVPKIFYGWLGNNDDVVDVPGRVNYVYVKMTDGMVTQAYNVVVPSILNLPVICGYDQNQLSSGLLKVLSVRNVPRQTPNSTPPGSTLVSHHKSHEWMNGDGGQDVTFIELRQYMPLRPSVIEPFTVRIERGVLNLNGVWKYLPSQTVDLSGYVPEAPVSGLSGSGVMGRYSLVSLEAVSGSPAVTSGSLVPITEISLSNVPTTPVGNYPICAVFTYYYQEKIVEARTRTDLIDLRSWTVSTGGTSGSTGSVSGSHNDLYGLQGGSTNERYHLTAAQYTIATQASGSGQAGYLTASDWNKFNTASGSQVVPNSHAPIANFYLTGYDKTSGSFSSGSVTGGSGGVEEAPIDGIAYVRNTADWVPSLYQRTVDRLKTSYFEDFNLTEAQFDYLWSPPGASGSGYSVVDGFTLTNATLNIRTTFPFLISGGTTEASAGVAKRYRVQCEIALYSSGSVAIGIAPENAAADIGKYITKYFSGDGIHLDYIESVNEDALYVYVVPADGGFTGTLKNILIYESNEHNGLSDLQGGQTDEYYHLTSSQHTIATQASGSAKDGYLKSEDYNQFKLASAGSGAWYLSDLLDVNIGAQTDGQALVWDADASKWIPGSAGASGSSGIPEAPVDGKTYGRKDAGWTEIVSGSGGGGGIEEAPTDGNYYMRKDAGWVPLYGTSSGSLVSTSTATGETPHTLTPTGVLPGDVLIAIQTTRNSASGSITGGGWSQLWFADLSSDEEVKAYWKVAGASEPESYLFSHTSGTTSISALVIYRGLSGSLVAFDRQSNRYSSSLPGATNGFQVVVFQECYQAKTLTLSTGGNNFSESLNYDNNDQGVIVACRPALYPFPLPVAGFSGGAEGYFSAGTIVFI